MTSSLSAPSSLPLEASTARWAGLRSEQVDEAIVPRLLCVG
ncbi:hypothetical protein [Candidatus Methylomirabilis sp.]